MVEVGRSARRLGRQWGFSGLDCSGDGEKWMNWYILKQLDLPIEQHGKERNQSKFQVSWWTNFLKKLCLCTSIIKKWIWVQDKADLQVDDGSLIATCRVTLISAMLQNAEVSKDVSTNPIKAKNIFNIFKWLKKSSASTRQLTFYQNSAGSSRCGSVANESD